MHVFSNLPILKILPSSLQFSAAPVKYYDCYLKVLIIFHLVVHGSSILLHSDNSPSFTGSVECVEDRENCQTKARSGKALEARSSQALEEDSSQVIEAAYEFASQSKHPSYPCVMSFNYIRRGNLYVPSTFVKQVNEAAGSVKVKLQCRGKEWDALLSTYETLWWMHNGWSTFVEENSLQIGDACVLELIDREAALIKVTVFKCTN
nr:PREDICTED: B3 domain-containing transcription factor VRN1-like [Daucus carota subsp. sativus]